MAGSQNVSEDKLFETLRDYIEDETIMKITIIRKGSKFWDLIPYKQEKNK